MNVRKMRILHAPALVINQQWVLSRAQRKLGYKSDVMTFNAGKKDLLAKDCDFDFAFDRNNISLKLSKILPSASFLLKFGIFFVKALFRYDVFHFHSESFMGSASSLDLALLRFFKKKIMFQYWGCDIRMKTMSILSGNYSTCDDCIRVCKNSRKLRDNLMHLKYADSRVYGGTDEIRMVPDAIYLPLAVDLDYWKDAEAIPEEHRLPESGNVRVLHPFENAKSRGDQKGAKFIKKAVEDLKREGYKIDYIFVEDVPHDSMRYYYQQADIVAVQLLMGTYGGVSVEAMAMGKPVICYLNKDAERLLPKDNPIVNADPKNITDKLRMLVKDATLRNDIGKKSKKYIEKHHDALKVAREFINLYQKDWR